MKLKKLPIGISTFSKIIEDDYIYVDKTKIAQDLIESGQYYFLSRPRRFGKSLFLDTLRTIFDGEKEIFKGLYIYENGYEFKKYPIIRISFNDGDFKSKEGFKQTLYEIIKRNQELLQIKCDNDLSIEGCFRELIYRAYEKYDQKVVILIDEYDKPILDNIENKEEVLHCYKPILNFFCPIIIDLF